MKQFNFKQSIAFAMMVLSLMVVTSSCKKESNEDSPSPSSSSTPQTGSVTFWYNSSGSIATVIINGQTGSITQYYATYDPTCGSAGCANFTLPTGNYSYSASSTWSTWSGTVAISNNVCTMILLN